MADWTQLEVEWPDADMAVQIVLLGFITLRVMMAVWTTASPGSWIDALATWALLIAGGTLIFAAIVDLDLRRWGRVVATIVLVAYGLAAAALASETPALGTDAIMFSKEAALQLLGGANPYAADMHGSFDLEGAAYTVSTARVDGSMVSTWSYPAGTILAVAPAAAFGIEIRHVVLFAAVGMGALAVAVSPPEWALAGLGSTILARDFYMGAIGGLIDPLWMLPTLVAMVLWARDRWLLAAFALGLAVGTKQHAWFLLPFMAVWVWKASDSTRSFAYQATRLIAAGAAGVLVLNLPFILWDPIAWVHGIMTPIRGASMVPLGIGITMITRLGLYPVATWWHTVVVALAGIVVLTWYARTWDRTRWLAWVLPAAVLMFHYRSLPTYALSWLPMAWLAVLIHRDRLVTRWLP